MLAWRLMGAGLLLLLSQPAVANDEPPAPATTDCRGIIPTAQNYEVHSLQAEDLVRLRDIGPPEGTSAGGGLISASPDGNKLAFQIRRADPVSNSYCLAMVVMDARPGASPTVVDQGGELIRYQYDNLWGMAGWPTGWPADIVPRWSPDGKWIAFLKQQGPHVQVWRAKADGSKSEAITRAPDDVVDFAWLDDESLMLATRPDNRRLLDDIEREGRSGFLFDDRFWPLARSRPMVRAGAELAAFHLDLQSHEVRPATTSEAQFVKAAPDENILAHALLSAAHGDRLAWISKRDPDRYVSPTTLSATLQDGSVAKCETAECGQIVSLWWPPQSHDVIFLARTGWGRDQLTLYRWNPDANRLKKVLETGDLLISCEPSGSHFFCLREGSTRPRYLVDINLDDGSSHTLFDPNPEIASRQLGQVTRLHWRNDRGIECFGDLVLPPTHKRGEKHPLIIVQYQTRGFLRGGTGDEYPIFLFAAHGFAVLSVQRPPEIGGLMDTKNQIEFERANISDWADRKSVISALLQGIKLAESRGVIDQNRIGITGLSDGVSTVMHALIDTDIFKAVSISQCCDDAKVQSNYGDSQFSVFLEAAGYPSPGDERPGFWKQHSIAANASKISAPILIQVSDDEFRTSLETFSVLRRLNKPIDMYVFPDEHHIKWQPVHRLAVYQRNLNWFNFWLQNSSGQSLDGSAELSRWAKMKRTMTDDARLP